MQELRDALIGKNISGIFPIGKENEFEIVLGESNVRVAVLKDEGCSASGIKFVVHYKEAHEKVIHRIDFKY